MWFISAVGSSGGIAFHEKTIVFVARPVSRRAGVSFAIPSQVNRNVRRSDDDEEEKPVRQRRRRRVPGGVRVRVRRVRHARVVGQRSADHRRAARPTRSLAALLQVVTESPGVRRAPTILRRLQMGLRPVHRRLLRHSRLPVAS